MRSYRLFLVDEFMRIEQERALQAPDDDEAKQMADKARAGRPAELWTTKHRIARWR